MNLAAIKAADRRKQEFDGLGLEEYRVQALQNLKLKTVIKESHCSPIHAMCFNQTNPDLHNIFATVGKDQATIYDDDHMVDNIGVLVQFTNANTEYTEGGELQACCWLNGKGWCDQLEGDACLAVAGTDPNISIISVVEARVIKLLKGHAKEVIDLAAVPSQPTLLLSLSKDGNVRLWDVVAEAELSSIQTDANSIALKEDGSAFVIGTTRGRIFQFDIADDKQGKIRIMEGSKQEFKVQGGGHTEAVDCMRYLSNEKLITKSCDGRMYVWETSSGIVQAAWKVPGSSPLGGFNGRCQFSTTPDARYIAVGNASGDCYVYDTTDGKRLAHTSSIRVSAPVRACALTPDCRHLVAAIGKGFIFRFEYLGRADEEEEEENDENENNENVNASGAANEEQREEEEDGEGGATETAAEIIPDAANGEVQ